MIAGFAVLLLVILGLGVDRASHVDRPHPRPRLVHVARQRHPARATPARSRGNGARAASSAAATASRVPLAGALLQRVAGISAYSFSAFLMVAIPMLTGLALGAGVYRAAAIP